MEEETLLAMVNRWLHAYEEILWRAVRSTLETFAERLDKNDSRHLARSVRADASRMEDVTAMSRTSPP